MKLKPLLITLIIAVSIIAIVAVILFVKDRKIATKEKKSELIDENDEAEHESPEKVTKSEEPLKVVQNG